MVKLADNLEDVLYRTPRVPSIAAFINDRKIDINYRDNYIYLGDEHKVVPKPTDVVMEAGVYMGRDTAMYAKLAKQVIGFEPSPRNYTKAKKTCVSSKM